MIKFTVLYGQPNDPDHFDRHYRENVLEPFDFFNVQLSDDDSPESSVGKNGRTRQDERLSDATMAPTTASSARRARRLRNRAVRGTGAR